MLRIVSYIKGMRWLCLCLLISLPALLAEPAHTSSNTVSQIALPVDTQVLSEADIEIQLNSANTRNKTREFANWLNFASVPDAINLLHGLMSDPDMNITQKEAVLHRLTQHLRTSPPDAADKAVMLELTGYQSQVQAQHHDDSRFTRPAFNIAGSAQGALNEWRYQEIRNQLTNIDIIHLWDNTDHVDRQLLLSALRTSPVDQSTLENAMQHTHSHPQLAAASILGSRDTTGAIELINRTSTDTTAVAALDIVKTSISANNVFSEDAVLDILEAASHHSDPVVSGLALDALAKRQPETQNLQRLVDQLSDPVKGASAAMTLATLLNNDQLSELEAASDPGNNILQARIKLIRQLRGEVQ